MPTASLQEVLTYQNELLVRRFSAKRKLTLAESEDLFHELLKWLWFLANRDTNSSQFPEGFPTLRVQGPIDAFWHEFILDTRSYRIFCEDYFGLFLHHIPTPEVIEVASPSIAHQDPTKMRELTKSLVTHAMQEVHDVMGKETMMRWYVELPQRYPQLV